MTHEILMIAVIALVTMATRFLPFLIFREGKQTPLFITRLGGMLPHAVMGMLVVYCLKDIRLTGFPFGLPELLGCAAVVGLHLWKRSTLLSIAGGTAVYMLLLRFVF